MNKHLLIFVALLICSMSWGATVKYPSLVQPQVAQSSSAANKWTLYNNLFSASYSMSEGDLYFDGSNELGLGSGSEPFEITLQNGTTVKASEMTMTSTPTIKDLIGNASAGKDSEKYNGKALQVEYSYNNLTFVWRAVLRDGSHYLRTELSTTASVATPMTSLTPMNYKLTDNSGDVQVVGNTRGAPLASDKIFAGLETPLGINSISSSTSGFSLSNWTPESWGNISNIPSEVTALGFTAQNIRGESGEVTVKSSGNATFTFTYKSGNNRINLLGVDLLSADGTVVSKDYHIGYSGDNQSKNTYTISAPSVGEYTLRFFAENSTEPITSSGNITTSGATFSAKSTIKCLLGKWSRTTTIKAGETWSVGSVVGLIAEGQRRRSFLAYHERERAVSWRSFVHYNSWYELNIDRNNSSNPLERMTEEKCVPVLAAWKKNLFTPYNLSIDAFVWDDGWDNFNSLWDFHIGFPQGFSNLNASAAEQKAGIGAWLGPVGGYGSAKAQRIAYWNKTYPSNQISEFKLSDPIYFNAFVGRCTQMINDYDMRYFKFDGISSIGNATGPDKEEDAEGFITLVSALRKERYDVFFNCTVGTWASPFWFQCADAVWRQDADWSTVGNQGDNREKWITYRDRMVWQNFTSLSPMCPINSLMTHGLIVSKYGPPAAMPRDNSESTYKGIVREMHCAFGCGSGLIELYVDNDLMTSIGGGKLWGDLAECIYWHRENKDVLADIHWVGGCPWDGSKANIYGWASWNETKSTLTLRNPSASQQIFTTTLRQALDIPEYITGQITLSDAFKNQTQYEGITGETIDLDQTITFNMPAFDVVVLNGQAVEEKEMSGSINISNTDGGRGANIKFKTDAGINMSSGWMQIGYLKKWNGKTTLTAENIAENFVAVGKTGTENLSKLSAGGSFKSRTYTWDNELISTVSHVVAIVGNMENIKNATCIAVLKLDINDSEILWKNADQKSINFSADETVDHIVAGLGNIIEDNGIKYLQLSPFSYPVGIKYTQTDNSSLKIYSTAKQIYIYDTTESDIIKITDLNGKTLKQENAGGTKYQTYIPNTGTYIVSVSNKEGNQKKAKKVICK